MTTTTTTHPPRVALFTDSEVFAGTERHMLDLACGLRDAGADVRLACPVPSALADLAGQAGIPVTHIPKRGLLGFTAVRALVKLLRSGALDLIHAHNGRTSLLAALAVRRAGQGRAVATQHFLEPAHVARRGVKALVSRVAHHWVNRQMSRFVAISEAVMAAMLTRGEGTEKEISLVPNGMPVPEPSALATPEAIRAELGLEPGTTLLVSVARLEPEKNLEVLVAAMKKVAAEDPSIVCVIAGEGSRRASLRSQISIAGLDHSVRLLGFRTDTLALMRAADVFILPSAREPFGLVLIESMSVGTPVIATSAGGPLEIVIHSETGLLVAPAAAGELGLAILTLVRDAALRKRMGDAGRRRFLDNFTVERMAVAILEAYGKARQHE